MPQLHSSLWFNRKAKVKILSMQSFQKSLISYVIKITLSNFKQNKSMM